MQGNIIQLPVPIQPRVISTRQMWLNMDREKKVQEECKERRENPPKLTPLQKKIINLVVLQNE